MKKMGSALTSGSEGLLEVRFCVSYVRESGVKLSENELEYAANLGGSFKVPTNNRSKHTTPNHETSFFQQIQNIQYKYKKYLKTYSHNGCFLRSGNYDCEFQRTETTIEAA
ncbi:MAG: hypothetical protein CVV02_03890 [Firmicutes bacterium HGW-Firmicutes-7]|nr:MAG: hypothetical protein CVV02_03890 [Firmicutes bacterium HGW-Firmicutes-7]